MNRQILFEGKVILANMLVDFRIYKNEDGNSTCYSYEINPEVKDVNQIGYHRGEIQRAADLATLLFRFNEFKKEFSEIDSMRFNKHF